MITSHILGSLTGLCDYIHVLANGKISLTREKEHFAGLEQEIFRDTDTGYAELVNSLL
jgi:ABC-2 type transport system ATP-binding protein